MSDELTGTALREAIFLTPEAASALIGMDVYQFLKHALRGEVVVHNVATNVAYPAERWMIVGYLNGANAYLRVEEGELKRFAKTLSQQIFQHAPAETPKKARTGRKDELSRAIEAALTILQAELDRKPVADEVFRYLAKRDSTGTIMESTNDTLIWADTRSKEQITSRRALEKRLARRG